MGTSALHFMQGLDRLSNLVNIGEVILAPAGFPPGMSMGD